MTEETKEPNKEVKKEENKVEGKQKDKQKNKKFRQQKSEEKKPKRKLKNQVLIGGKSFMNYVNAVVMQFTIESKNEVIISARGKYISRAVDIAEVSMRKLKKTIEYKEIKVGSEQFKNNEGKDQRSSTIDITMKKCEVKKNE